LDGAARGKFPGYNSLVMRRPLPTARLLPLALSLALINCQGKPPEAQPERQRLAGAAKGWNVVLLTVDTLRADRLGAYGYTARPTSPRLDAEIAAGVRFEQAMAPRAATWPSLASLLTGLYPRSHGVTENGYSFPNDLATLPKLLKQAGYRTGAFLSNMCKANHQGWDNLACTGGEDGKTIQRALDWAKEEAQGDQSAGRPYFLWVHLFGAHGPYYNGGDRAARELDPGYQGPVGPKRWQLDRIMTEKVALNERDIRHLDALYDGAVMGTDGLSAALLDGLRAAGKMDKTLLVFTADHGEELYDHNGYLYHACSVYQTTLHVPLAIQAPGLISAGARVPQTVELIDVAPTLLEMLGLPALPMQHGRSLVPYLERPGEGGAGKPAFSEYGVTNVGTVVQGDWKLIQNPDGFVPVCIPGAAPGHYPIGKVELYNLAADPLETTNLAEREPGRVAELSQVLRQRFSNLPRRTNGQDVPEELRKELEALGYVAP
jgi:arylsulfatase A-like enzyme